MPKFTVIVPSYGRPRFLRDAIHSVQRQTVHDYQIVVVDDASPEPILLPDHPRVRLIRAEVNGGAAAARNLGVESSDSEFIAFLDDDDEWHPRRLEYALAALERAPVGVCWQNTSGRILEGNVFSHILDVTTPSFGATSMLRSAWSPIDESYRAVEDVAWWLAITRHSRVATHPQQGLFVRWHEGARVGYGAEARIAASIRLLDEHCDYFTAHPQARAFRWKRIGLMYAKLGDKPNARRAFVSALRARPSAASVKHLVKAIW